jgi:hypothetical protein
MTGSRGGGAGFEEVFGLVAGWDLSPQGMQRLLNFSRWEADAVRDDLRALGRGATPILAPRRAG